MRILAKSIPEILSKTNRKTLGRATTISPTLKGQKGKSVMYEVKGDKSYEVEIQFQDPNNVLVRCSCDAFVFQGSEYHAHKGDYLLGKARGNLKSPDKRDPEGKNLVCKHIVAVFDVVLGNSVKRVASRYLFDT